MRFSADWLGGSDLGGQHSVYVCLPFSYTASAVQSCNELLASGEETTSLAFELPMLLPLVGRMATRALLVHRHAYCQYVAVLPACVDV